MKSLVIAIDFDGTIVKDAFPEVGELQENAKKRINQLKSDGHTILIHTCRDGIHQKQAEEFLEENGIAYDYINENTPIMMERYQNNSRKLGADVYIDDKSIWHEYIDWDELYQQLSDMAKGV